MEDDYEKRERKRQGYLTEQEIDKKHPETQTEQEQIDSDEEASNDQTDNTTEG